MQMSLARIDLDVGALRTYATMTRTGDDNGLYAVHHALRMRFGDAAPQPFHAVLSGPEPHVVGYLPEDAAQALADAPPCEDGILCRVFGAEPQTRAMPRMWKEGARLSFRLRAWPTVRYSPEVARLVAERTGWTPPGREIDAVEAESRKTGTPADPEVVCRSWLERRLDPCASIEGFVLRDYARVRSLRSQHDGGRRVAITGPDAVMAGTLVVRDAERFGEIVRHGVGRHAAFGYGMLLMSPAR